MSSIWDPPDPPEVIEAQREAAAEKAAREALAAKRAAQVEAEAKVARMQAIYARAAACSLLDPEGQHPESQHPEGQHPESAARKVVPAPPVRPTRSSGVEIALQKEEAARREVHAELRASMSATRAEWRAGLPLPPLDPPGPPRLEYARTTDSYGVAVSLEERDRTRSSTAPQPTSTAGPSRVVVFHPTPRSGGRAQVPAASRVDRSRRTLSEGNVYRSILEREAHPPTPPKGVLRRVANWIWPG